MKGSVFCVICASTYNGIRKPGDMCGDLSYARDIATAPRCPGVCIPIVGNYEVYRRAHDVVRELLRPIRGAVARPGC
jgi:hypothetical protein